MTVAEVATACQAAGLDMTPGQLRRWLLERHHHHPGLIQGSKRKWRIQRHALNLALGGEGVDLQPLVMETAARVDEHDRLHEVTSKRLARLEAQAGDASS